MASRPLPAKRDGDVVILSVREVADLAEARLKTALEDSVVDETERAADSLPWLMKQIKGYASQFGLYDVEAAREKEFIARCKGKYDLDGLTPSEWIQILQIRPRNNQTLLSIVEEGKSRFPTLFDDDDPFAPCKLLQEINEILRTP